jgi:hypothetical protein
MTAEVTAGASGMAVAEPAAPQARQPRPPGGPGHTGEWLAWDRSDTIKAGAAAAISSAALTAMVVISIIIVSLAASHQSFLSPTAKPGDYPAWLAGPLAPLTSWLPLGSSTLNGIFIGGVSIMYVAYVAVLICAPRLRPAYALGAVVALQVIFFLSPPLPLTDIFNYLNYGRMEVIYHLNPYTTIPALEPHNDPTFALSNWHGLESPYGPLLTLFTMAVVPLGVAASFWILKAVLLLTSLASVWLIWSSAGLLGRNRLGAALFLGLNPIVLVWGLGADHSDFLMIVLIELALYVLLRARVKRSTATPASREHRTLDSVRERLRHAWRRVLAALDGAPRPLPADEPGWWWEIGAGVLLAGAVALKASALILIPIVLAGSARRLRLLVGLLIGAAGFGFMSYAAFGATVPDLAQQDKLVIPTGIPNLVGYILGFGGETAPLRTLFTAALVLTVLACSVWAWRTRDWVMPCAVASLVLLMTLSWVLPWYLVWLLPFAALARGRRIRIAAIVLGVFMFISWMPSATSLYRDIGIHPTTTLLGRANARYLHLLLDG